MTSARAPLAAEYVLPIRWNDDGGMDELTGYLGRLAHWIDVTVVDGSDADAFAAHARAWSSIRHVPPTGDGLNGKARGALTGIRAARHDRVVIADDDVRYERDELFDVVGRLDSAHFVRPQNVFVPAPWHARWDTGRSLLNRTLGGDFAGTVALRRSALPARGYDTDVLFENLELERTVRAGGHRVDVALDVIVARRPPSVRRFLEQRVRQAYDDFAQPSRLVREPMLLPLAVLIARRRGVRGILALAAILVLLAAVGRSRAGGRARYRATDALWAPLWAAERAVTVWVALVLRCRGGVRYRDARIRRSAHSIRALRRMT